MKIIKSNLKSVAFGFGLIGTVLVGGGVVYAKEGTNSYSSVNMTVPSEINVVMNEDGSNSISEFYVQNDMLIPARINDISISGNNGWNLVSKDTEIHADIKTISLSVQGYDLKTGNNTVDIAIPEEKRTDLSIDIKRGSFTAPVNETAFAIEIGYALETKEFTVGFYGNGYDGSISSITAKNGSSITLPIISRSGYTFDGWKNAEGVVYKGGSSYVMPIGSHTLTAQWSAITYKVIYNANYGTGTTATQTMTYDKDMNLSSNGFMSTGRTFVGWNTNEFGTGTAYTDGQSVKNLTATNGGTVTLYAQWQKNRYKTTIDNNNGDSVYSFESEFGTLNALTIPKKTGYDFAGWTNSNGSNRLGSVRIDTYIKDDKSYNCPIYPYKYAGGDATSYGNFEIIESSADNPSNLKYETKINATSVYQAHGMNSYVGFYTARGSYSYKSNTEYIHTFLAKLPKGTRVQLAYNNLGTNPTITWLTSPYGTGEWEYYTYRAKLGEGASDLAIGYIFIHSIDDNVLKAPFSWNLAWSKIIEIGNDSKTHAYVTDAANTTLTANWSLHDYSISFDTNNGILIGTTPSSYNIESSDVALPTPSRDGYTFGGWYENSNFSGSAVTKISKGSTGDKKYYAKWIPNTYSIAYNLDGGSASTSNPTSYNLNTNTFTLNNPTKTGYSFKGWTEVVKINNWHEGDLGDSTSGGNPTVSARGSFYSEPVFVKAGVTYSWPNHMLENTSVGAGTVGARFYDANGTYKTYLTGNYKGYTPTEDGYIRFLIVGYTEEYGNKFSLNSSVMDSVTINQGSYGNRTYTANWKVKTTNVVFYRNHDSNDTTTAVQSFTYDGANQYFKDNGWSKTGYTLAGYSKVRGSATADFIVTNNVVNSYIDSTYPTTNVYGVWKPNIYTVTFNTQGGTSDTSSKNVTYDSTYGILPTPTKYGYTFGGWFTSASGGTQITSSSKVSITANTTLYAQWNINTGTVKFEGNGATGGSMADMSVRYDTSANLNANAFSKTGYTFSRWKVRMVVNGVTKYRYALNGSWGWYEQGKQPTGSTEVTWIDGNGYINATIETDGAVIYCTAQWTPNTYTIAFNGLGASSGATASKSMTYDTASTLTTNGFIKNGYTFAGWNTNQFGTGTAYTDGQSVKNLTATNGGTVTLYAQWTPNTLNAKTNVNGGTGAGFSSVNDNIGRLITPGTPTKTGHTFNKWTQQSGATGYLGSAILSDPRDGFIRYDNSNSGNVTIVKDTSVTHTHGSYAYKITHTGKALPSYGGFYKPATSYANAKFVHTFYAKLPKGTFLQDYRNPIGDGGSSKWITSNYGTGEWQWYAYEVNCGSTGTFGTFGHIALHTETVPTTSSPITWYVGYNQIVDVTKGYGDTYVMGYTNDTLTANYTVNDYTLTYNANGGSVATASKSVAYGSAYGTLPEPTREGYTFLGWFTAPTGGTQVTADTVMGAANTTIYAQWEIATISFTFNSTDRGMYIGSSTTYTAEPGMTWREFINSSYNVPWNNYIFGIWGTEQHVTFNGQNYVFIGSTDSSMKAYSPLLDEKIIDGETYWFDVRQYITPSN